MSRLSIFAGAAVLLALTATPVAFAKEHHHVRKAPQFASEHAAAAREAYATFDAVGREVSAPPWSAACTTDHAPSACGEPMWVYSSPARSRDNR
jgi:hypothetical protein